MTTTTKPRQVPRDGRLLSLILASKGIADADERVIHQLLDFAHRYTADVLQSSQALADHATRTGAQANRIEKEDVELAIQMRRRYEFFEAPPRDYLANLAHELNAHPLPPLPESFEVVRLPPPSQRVAEVTFDIVPNTAAAKTLWSDNEDDEEGDKSAESESESESEEEDAEGDEDPASGPGVVAAAAPPEDEDEEMEEVGVPAEREVDEDYDA